MFSDAICNLFSCWGLSREWCLCWEMRWSPASCERALRCLSGINQAGQRNLNLERVVSTNISPSGYINPNLLFFPASISAAARKGSVGQNLRPHTIISRLWETDTYCLRTNLMMVLIALLHYYLNTRLGWWEGCLFNFLSLRLVVFTMTH